MFMQHAPKMGSPWRLRCGQHECAQHKECEGQADRGAATESVTDPPLVPRRRPAWLGDFRRLVFHYERHALNYLGLVQLGRIIIVMRQG